MEGATCPLKLTTATARASRFCGTLYKTAQYNDRIAIMGILQRDFLYVQGVEEVDVFYLRKA
jgi:hypothetical protein